jgi:hypothetical protein
VLTRAAIRVRVLRWKSRYTRALESEVAQLRAEYARVREENRALLNSILGIAGIPPIIATPPAAPSAFPHPAGVPGVPFPRAGVEAEAPRSHPSPVSGPEAPALGPVSPLSDANATARPKNLAQAAAPLPRRSWQQINRTLEFEAAHKKPPQDVPEA